MKKIIRYILNISLLGYGIYLIVETFKGFAETSRQIAELKASNASGVDYLGVASYPEILLLSVCFFAFALSIYFNLRYFLLSRNKKMVFTVFNIMIFAVSVSLVLCIICFNRIHFESLKVPELIITVLAGLLLLLRFVCMLVKCKTNDYIEENTKPVL